MTIRVTFKDGRQITEAPALARDIADMLHANIVGDDPAELAAFCDAPLIFGDDILDGWQGVYWLLKNRFLGDCQPITACSSSHPVVAVGSGPGLDESIDALAASQSAYFIVAAHSAAPRLLRAGIVPDLVTPAERTDTTYVIDFTPPAQTAYAGLPCVPHDPPRYAKHYLVAGNDLLWRWAGYGHASIPTGSTTGVNAVAVAATISPTVYLIGHDLVKGHYAGYNAGPEDPALGCMELPCNDTLARVTSPIWERCKREIEGQAKRIPWMSSCDAHGARLLGVPFRALPPRVSTVPKQLLHTCDARIPRAEILRQLALGMPLAMERSVERMRSVTSIADMRSGVIADPEYVAMISYVFRSLWMQMTLEVRIGTAESDIVAWCKEAYANAVDGIMGSAREIASDALR